MSLKLSLDEPATEAVHAMLTKLKETNPDCGASPSGLASWILTHFAEKSFDKSKTKIAGYFFNPKAYLRTKLKDIDCPEKLEAMLVEVRSRLRASIENNNRSGPEHQATIDQNAGAFTDTNKMEK